MTAESEDAEAAHTIHNFLQLHLALMLAYSKAGCKQLASAPQTEPRGTDTTTVVELPLDVLMRYHYRIQERVYQIKGNPLAWVMQWDEQDRAAWVDRYRNGTDSLGAVVLSVMGSREATWEIPRPMELPPPPAPKQQQPQNRDKPTKTKLASKLRDGTKLCTHYQRGKCRNSSCKFAHTCAVVTPSGRVCGARHQANQHTRQSSQ